MNHGLEIDMPQYMQIVKYKEHIDIDSMCLMIVCRRRRRRCRIWMRNDWYIMPRLITSKKYQYNRYPSSTKLDIDVVMVFGGPVGCHHRVPHVSSVKCNAMVLPQHS
jgi:hypothetical protein